jgi:hypothetical protein
MYTTGSPSSLSHVIKTLRVLLICRVSSPGEGKQDIRSLDDQEAMLRRWLLEHVNQQIEVTVTYSGTSLWNAVASVPPEQIRTDPATRAALGDAFFFDPSYHVGRVIYIGTPHLGSSWAVRTAGRLGSALVEPSPLAESRQAQLIRDNPNVFSDEISQRFPTSVDLLEPTSPLLNATTRLPYRRNVALHSIIGERHSPLGSDPSDGIVPVSSARLPGVASEKVVDCRHMQLPHNEVVAAEVIRLLVEHAQAIDVSMPGSTSNQWRPNSIYRGDCSDESLFTSHSQVN